MPTQGAAMKLPGYIQQWGQSTFDANLATIVQGRGGGKIWPGKFSAHLEFPKLRMPYIPVGKPAVP